MAGYRWVNSSGGVIPEDAVHAGFDLNGGRIFAGRVYYNGDLLPAKVTPSHGCAFISYAGNEIQMTSYEVLCSSQAAWESDRGGSVPRKAIKFGHTRDGESLFMGRTMVKNTLTPGKIHPTHGCLYVPFGGKELTFTEYEVLVLT